MTEPTKREVDEGALAWGDAREAKSHGDDGLGDARDHQTKEREHVEAR